MPGQPARSQRNQRSPREAQNTIDVLMNKAIGGAGAHSGVRQGPAQGAARLEADANRPTHRRRSNGNPTAAFARCGAARETAAVDGGQGRGGSAKLGVAEAPSTNTRCAPVCVGVRGCVGRGRLTVDSIFFFIAPPLPMSFPSMLDGTGNTSFCMAPVGAAGAEHCGALYTINI